MLKSCEEARLSGTKIFTFGQRPTRKLHLLSVSVSIDDGGSEVAAATGCAGCGAVLAPGQRYCLECGTRRGAMPAIIASRISAMLHVGRAKAVAEEELPPDAPAAAAGLAGSAAQFMPDPKVAAVAVMGLLAFGVLLGSVTSQVAQSAGITPLLLQAPATTASSPAPVAPIAAAPPAAAPIAPAAAPAPAPAAPAAGPYPSAPPIKLPPDIPPEPTLPPVKHLYMIVLGDQGYDQTFAPKSTDTYLSKTLAGQGELLSNYYAVAQGDLANEVALISGQGPTPEIAANCPNYTELTPGTADATGQATGTGCVFPAPILTVGDQLATAGKTWRAYVEGVANTAGQTNSCRRPTIGDQDPNQVPISGDAYETWRNPFVYFHSLLDGGSCAQNDVGLEQLSADLKVASTAPTLSYIVPNACHDGSEQPCDKGQPAGLQTADDFLKTVVPQIQSSPAYKDNGLIAITFAQAPQTGPNADSSACCVVPQYPNLPVPADVVPPANGPIKPTGGGGHVGMLLISPFVKAGTTNDASYFNHFSMLSTIETLFGLQSIGYATDPGAFAFDSAVFNGYVQEN